MTTTHKKELLAKVSEYIDASLQEQSKEIAHIRVEAKAEIERHISESAKEIAKIRTSAEHEIAQIRSDAAKETAAIKAKLQSLVQTEDNNKFQKRTIASLTSEIATMQTTITNLEKRLKLATEEVRSLKQSGRLDLSGPPVKMQPQTHQVPVPQVPVPQVQVQVPQVPQEQEQPEQPNQEQTQMQQEPEDTEEPQ